MDLIKLGGNLENPRNSKPSDYPAVGPTGAEGMSSGEGALVKQTDNQWRPMGTQDNGDQTPSVWGKADWTVGKSSADAGTSVACPVSVDLKDGFVAPDVRTKPY